MIKYLKINNIAIIKDLMLDFKCGMTSLIGESGSGKSLIIESINIVSGKRVSKSLIRNGEKEAFVELTIIQDNKEIVIKRILYKEKNTVAFINNSKVTSKEVFKLLEGYICIHSQNDSVNFLDENMFYDLIDSHIDNKEIIVNYKKSLKEYKNLLFKYNSYLNMKNNSNEFIKDLEYKINLLESIDISVEKEKQYNSDLKKLTNIELISKKINMSKEYLSNHITDNLYTICENNKILASYDSNYINYQNKLDNCFYVLGEYYSDLTSNEETNYINEEYIDDINSYLYTISMLKKRFNCKTEDLLTKRQELTDKLSEFSELDALLSNCNIDLAKAYKTTLQFSNELNNERKKIFPLLEKVINDNFTTLNLDNSVIKLFSIEISSNIYNSNFTEFGKDIIDFKISTNIGESFYNIDEIASGGEKSRIILALNTILNKHKNIVTNIFDEIDTGISGESANCVGNFLKLLSKDSQVIIISHNERVYEHSDYIYEIYKVHKENRTFTKTKKYK